MQGEHWTEKQRNSRLAHLLARNRAGHGGQFLYEDADWMRDAYLVRNLSLRQIAAEAACGLRTIARWMAIHQIEMRPAVRQFVLSGPDHPNWTGGPRRSTCEECGTSISPRSRTCVSHRGLAGEHHGSWRGDAIKNPAMHGRVKTLRGPASAHPCQHCGGTSRDWAYDHADPDERTDPEGPFSLDPKRYMPLCVTCHKRFDMTHLGRRRGH